MLMLRFPMRIYAVPPIPSEYVTALWTNSVVTNLF